MTAGIPIAFYLAVAAAFLVTDALRGELPGARFWGALTCANIWIAVEWLR